MQSDWHLAVDIGGTFTDLLLVDRRAGTYRIEKLLTTLADPASAVLEGLVRVLADEGAAPQRLESIAHATTLVTNAVIERKGARTALLVTAGFRDVLSVAREHRYDMYDVRLEKPDPLASRQDTFGVPERLLADGTVHLPLDHEAVSAIASELRRRRIDAVAVCLLHAYANPSHELAVRQILEDDDPRFNVTLSHEVVGELREYERASTTVANAYVLGLADRYLSQLELGLRAIGHDGHLLVMLSNGAVATAETARRFPVRLIESGPAAGAIAAAEAGIRMGQPDLLSFDMGGTTAKACVITKGRPTTASELEVARLSRFRKGSGLPVKVPSVELIEIGAGGGSLARIDGFGLVQVGPESAGSDPGPACYGRNGSRPTVTDADLLLGYLNPDYFLGGKMALDVEAARHAVSEELAEPLGVSLTDAAWYVHEVVNENMANAARVHAVEIGAELRRLPLFSFGGAGPVHAFRVAQNLGITLVISPLGAGVGSTIGLLAAPLAFDFVRTLVAPLSDLDWPMISATIRAMEQDGVELLERAGLPRAKLAIEWAADMRLSGQAYEITVELHGRRPRAKDEGRLLSAFSSTYVALFGRQPPGVPVEVVNWRVRVVGPRPAFPLIGTSSGSEKRSGRSSAAKGRRDAYFPESGSQSTPVYDRYRLAPGDSLAGPAIVEERESTFVVGPGGQAHVDEHLNLLVEISQ